MNKANEWNQKSTFIFTRTQLQRECRRFTSIPCLMVPLIAYHNQWIDIAALPNQTHASFRLVLLLLLLFCSWILSKTCRVSVKMSENPLGSKSFRCPLQMWGVLVFSTRNFRRNLYDINHVCYMFEGKGCNEKVPLTWPVTVTANPEFSMLNS